MFNRSGECKRRGNINKKRFAKAAFVLYVLLLALLVLSQADTSAKEITVEVGLATDQTGPLATDGRKGVNEHGCGMKNI